MSKKRGKKPHSISFTIPSTNFISSSVSPYFLCNCSSSPYLPLSSRIRSYASLT